MVKRASYRLFLRYLLIVIIPIIILLVVGTVSVAINARYVSRQIRESNQRALDQIRGSFNLTFDELDSLALSFSVSPDFVLSLNQVVNSKQLTFQQSNVLSTIRNFVDVAAFSRGYVQSIYAYVQNKGNKVLTTSDGIVDLSNFFDTSWYQSYLRRPGSELEWTERRSLSRFPKIASSQPVLSIFRRIYSLIGVQVPGVIVLNIDLPYLESVINGLRVSPEQRILIFDRDGRTLLSNFAYATEIWGTIRNSRNLTPTSETITLGGRQYVELHLWSSHNRWTYVALTPMSVFYSSTRTLRDLNMTIVLLSFIAGSVIVFFVSKRSFRHIENVVDIVEAAEQGDPLPPTPEQSEKGFSHIAYTILRTFVEHKYLTVQLSERNYRRRTLELQALQSQMNPHFLFNTLETINWKTIEVTKKPSEINEIISKLSNVLKYSLQSPFTFETLSNEIKHAKDYLAIQEIRYRGKFTVCFGCDSELENYKVIRFLLQPLLENAIYHGIKEAAGVRSIEIEVGKIADRIHIRVSDNGKGMTGERLLEVRRSLRSGDRFTEHIGLYNTNKRIQLAFGERYGLTIESVDGGGTSVMAELPATL